jgi:hypothetical protein
MSLPWIPSSEDYDRISQLFVPVVKRIVLMAWIFNDAIPNGQEDTLQPRFTEAKGPTQPKPNVPSHNNDVSPSQMSSSSARSAISV